MQVVQARFQRLVEGALAPNDSVVTRGAETLEDGALVRVVDLRTEKSVAGGGT